AMAVLGRGDRALHEVLGIAGIAGVGLASILASGDDAQAMVIFAAGAAAALAAAWRTGDTRLYLVAEAGAMASAAWGWQWQEQPFWSLGIAYTAASLLLLVLLGPARDSKVRRTSGIAWTLSLGPTVAGTYVSLRQLT